MKKYLHFLLRINLDLFFIALIAASIGLYVTKSNQTATPITTADQANIQTDTSTATLTDTASTSSLSTATNPQPSPKPTKLVDQTTSTTTNNEAATETSETSATTGESTNPDTALQQQSKILDLSAHATESDCWMTYRGHLYDLTNYLAAHPGGKAILVPYCGKNIDSAFDTKGRDPASPHSSFAVSEMQQYLIE